MKHLYISTHCTTDDCFKPMFGKLEVTPEFLAKVTKAQEVLSENGYDEATMQWPIEWPEDDEFTIDCHSLVVSRGGFWFEAWVNYQNGHVETTIADTDMLREILDGVLDKWYHNNSLEYEAQEFIDACSDAEEE